MAERQWTHDELQGLLEMGSSANLGKLIAEPGRKYRAEFARDYTLDALRNIAASDVLPDDIRALVQRVLVLYETASDPFLNLSTTEGQEQQGKPRMGIEAVDAEAQARQNWRLFTKWPTELSCHHCGPKAASNIPVRIKRTRLERETTPKK